jgi:hypothetical protein
MNKILTYILIFLTISCVDKKKEKELRYIPIIQKEMTNSEPNQKELEIEIKTQAEKFDSIFIDSTNFNFFNLKEFDLRDWYIGKMDEELKSPTKEKLLEYFQDDRINGENIYLANFKYFSIQKNEPTEKIITIIERDESCCSDLHYLVFNEKNELLSDNIIAGTGGDGMWSYDQYGKFLNDSTYILTRIDIEEIEVNESGTETEIHIDSIITNFRFHKRKTFIKLSEREFKKIQND